MTDLGAWASGLGVLETCRVEAGIPLFGRDFTEDTLFPEADLPEAVSYTKGCFVGQEVVARVKSRGHVNRRRTGLLVKGNASAGDSVFLGEVDLGPITSIAWSPRLDTHVAFAMLKCQPAEMAGQICMVKTSLRTGERPHCRPTHSRRPEGRGPDAIAHVSCANETRPSQ